MISEKKTAKLVGGLFLTVMISFVLGYRMIGGVLNTDNYLAGIQAKSSRIFLGVIFELIDISAIIGIIVLIFPLMKRYSERMALWYLCFRILECVMLIVAIIIPLVMITIGQEYLKSGAAEISWHQTLGTVLLAVRYTWVQLVLPFFYSLAGVVFFWFSYKTKLIPKFLSILGIISAGLVLAGIPMDFFKFKPGSFVGGLMGLTEIFLGIWLIVKGFNNSEIASTHAKGNA
jgi:hypothetical protein